MSKKIIGISANIEIATDSVCFAGCKRLKLYDEYVSSVIKAGAIPMIIPVVVDKKILEEQLNIIDGLIVSGGYDIDPLRYDEEPHPLLGQVFPERDEFEFALTKLAMEKQIPILGICRGHQVLNVVNGGTLYQDISLKEGNNLKHIQGGHGSIVSHKIKIEKDSILYNVLGENAFVNSLHHLAVKDVAKDFKVSAIASDGVIEAIERKSGSFAMGIQWHPEILADKIEDMLNLFKYFIKEIK